jgi:mRNA interferase MazF
MIIRRWSIYRANLDPVIGSEQGKSRPVLVISEDAINDLLSVVNVIPLTSRKEGRKIYPNEVALPVDSYGLSNESIVLCYQIRTLDKRRLSHFYGEITSAEKRSEMHYVFN